MLIACKHTKMHYDLIFPSTVCYTVQHNWVILQTDMRIFFLPILLVEMPQNLLLAVVLTHCKATSAEAAETQIAKKKKKKRKD